MESSRVSKILEKHTSFLEQNTFSNNYVNAPVRGEWVHSQREKRERLRERNQDYLDRLRYMLSYRESRVTERAQQIERATSQKEDRARQVAEMREKRAKERKEEGKLRNVYFSIQK